ncbi:MAG TPA: tetratricopeptide repeat protein [bacterium]|nr:tetratricopeptide repeat protein [bacterium]
MVRRAGLLVVAVALCAYGLAVLGDYVFDDVHSVSANPAVHDLANLGRFWTDPSTFSGAAARMYRPALLTSFALNLWISPAAWSIKLGNVLLHAAVAGLAFVWLWRLSRKLWAAFVAAALFAAHPLASEAVNLASARSELLSTFGIVMALFAHLDWQRRVATWGPITLIAVGTVLACGSKETGVVLPALLALQTMCLRHRLPAGRDWARAALAMAPVVGLCLAYLVARKLLLGEATVQLLDRTGGDPHTGHGRTLAVQLATMGTLLPRVLLQALLPVPLSLDPVVHYRTGFFDPAVLCGWGAVLGLTVLAWLPGPRARLRRLGSGLAWAIALPWVVIPLNVPLAEHRLYGPLLGLAVVFAAVLPRFARALRAVPRPVLLTAFAGCLVAGIVVSAHRSWLYRDECELWRAELTHNPRSFRAWWGIGTTRMRRGQMAEAVPPLRRAHELDPSHHDALRNLVEALIAVPDADADAELSLRMADKLAAMTPDDPWVRTLVAQANLQAGRKGLGTEHFRTAERVALSCLEIATPKGYVYRLAAFARHGLGDTEGALRHLDTAIANGLATRDVRLDRVRILFDLGRTRQARIALAELQREFPTDANVMALLRRNAASPPR